MEAITDPGLLLKVTPPKLRKTLLVRERLRRIGATDPGGDDSEHLRVRGRGPHGGRLSRLVTAVMDDVETAAVLK
jgi:hypothetical protein